MNESISILRKNRQSVLEQWMQKQSDADGFRDESMYNDHERSQSEELLNSLLDALNDKNLDEPESRDFDPAQEILAGISVSRAKQGYSPRENSNYIFSLREVILSMLISQGKPETAVNDLMRISRIFDHFGVTTFESFIKGREEVILRQTDEITEISTPVIRVWDSILALPIIGTLDSSRTQIVMENLLQEIVDTGSVIAILDISGVPAVDSLVAQHLIKTVSATRLMGAECIISGIRPEIAQTVVHLGIDLSNIITKSTLASALKTAFTMLQLDVVNKNQRQPNSVQR